MNDKFIHLNLHTEYSLLDSTIRIKSLLAAAVKQQMPALVITDHNNLFALVKFYRAAMQRGVKPVIGAEILLQNPQNSKHPFHAILLCKDKQGYQNLTRIISRAYLEGQSSGKPLVERKWVSEAAAGLIMLSGAQQGDIGQLICAGKIAQAAATLQRWQTIFTDNFYLELQRVGHENTEYYITNALQLSDKYKIPVVATNAVRFLQAEDFMAHEARVAIHDGYSLADSRRPKKYTAEQYFRSTEEMVDLFSDIPEAIENTVEIAKRCNLEIDLQTVHLPDFPVPANMTIEKYFRDAAQQGLQQRFSVMQAINSEKQTHYQQRLELELEVIKKMGFAGYFLIVADFIQWARDHQVPVGPGRGSGAGSLVAYVLKITDVDPLVHGLLFERFLNPERVSMPDFDIDFCMAGRDRVIEYVAQRYGRTAVSQIITYGTMAAKAVVRDVGRVLGHPYGFVDKLAKMIPFELGITLSKALQQDDQLATRYQQEEEVRELFDLALRLEGLTRNVGKHAGGVVIAPSQLTDFTPLYTESADGSLVSQFDKDDVEAVGLVKFDFLGLRTLTIIDWAVQSINQRLQRAGKSALNISHLPLDDQPTFKLLKACNTTAIFQLESRGMKDLIKRLQPSCFEDIVALNALFRPGPLQSGMVDDFIARRHGRAPVEYPHPKLVTILEETYGTILYQEQVMQIAQILAGYTLGNADMLRRAMGKKKPEEMAKQRTIFIEGAIKNGVAGKIAANIFDLMEKFAAYGFNKSHSVAYALLSYQTAWLKQHYPAEFMAAVLSSDMDNTDKVTLFFDDAKAQDITILAPSINHSEYKFTVNSTGQIVYGLGAIKGVGEAALQIICTERDTQGKFTDLFEFCQRINSRKVNRKVLEALAKSGALDDFKQERSVLLASLNKALKSAEQMTRNQDIGQTDLFAIDNTTITTAEYIQAAPWNEKRRLEAERESLGLFLSGHPLRRYQSELTQLVSCKIKEFTVNRERNLKIAGIIISVRHLNTRRGERMAIIVLDDRSGRTEVAVFSEMYQKFRELLIKDNIVVVEGVVQQDRFTGGYRFNTNSILSLIQARNSYAKGILLSLQKDTNAAATIKLLQQTLLPYKGGHCNLLIDYQHDGTVVRLNLGAAWKVKPADELLDSLTELVGEDKIMVIY